MERQELRLRCNREGLGVLRCDHCMSLQKGILLCKSYLNNAKSCATLPGPSSWKDVESRTASHFVRPPPQLVADTCSKRTNSRRSVRLVLWVTGALGRSLKHFSSESVLILVQIYVRQVYYFPWLKIDARLQISSGKDLSSLLYHLLVASVSTA